MRIAITRDVSPAIADCELTHLERRPIDYGRACAQHRAYTAALETLGCRVQALAADAQLPDSVFVEDIAVVLDEVAILTRPGAPARRAESTAVAAALSPYRPVRAIEAPGTIDGGDVLRVDRDVFVGVTGRTNQAAIVQLTAVLAPHGYHVHGIPVHGCLHLKSAVTQVAPGTLLVNGAWIDVGVFSGYDILAVEPTEPYAANGLLIDAQLIYPTSFPATARRLEARGISLVPVDVSELQKAEGAVTCCSLVFESSIRS